MDCHRLLLEGKRELLLFALVKLYIAICFGRDSCGAKHLTIKTQEFGKLGQWDKDSGLFTTVQTLPGRTGFSAKGC